MDTSSENKEKETLGTRTDIEEVDACKRRIKAAIPAEKIREELDNSYRELTKTVQMPGFRRGKVPRRLLESRFGEEIEKDIKESMVNASFAEVVEEAELKVIGSPTFDNIQLVKDADLTYEVELEVQPQFELGVYKGVEVEREAVSVNEEEVEEQLESLRKGRAKVLALDLAEAGADDYYYGKYHLLRDGLKVKVSDELTFVPSSKTVGPFPCEDLPQRAQDWDCASGNPLCLDVKVPQGYPDEVLRGLDLQLEFHLDDVKRPDLPELDDEFAKELGKETVAELREEIRASIESKYRRQQDTQIENKILENVVEATSMELPAGILETQRGRWRMQREQELLVEQGLTPDQVKETLEKEGEAAQEDLRRELKIVFVLERIAEQEKIFVTEDEINSRLQMLAMYYGVPPAHLRDEMRSSGRLDDIRESLRHEKVRAFLRKKAKIAGEEEKPEAETPPDAAAEAVEQSAEEETGSPQAEASAPGSEDTGGGGETKEE